MARIALDAMGGDFAPQATVAGALLALAELDPAHSIQLVGQTAVVEAHLRDLLDGDFAAAAIHRDRLSIVDAAEVIEMTDKPSAVVRGKPNSSMAVGLRIEVDESRRAFSKSTESRNLRHRRISDGLMLGRICCRSVADLFTNRECLMNTFSGS